MSVVLSVILFIAGLAMVIFFAERLVKGVVGTSLGFGISAFLISVIFLGFDPENLAVGAVGSFEEVPGIALGSVVGSAMVAISLAFGITALIVPMEFQKVPGRYLIMPVFAVLLLWILCFDGELSRPDGMILLAGFALSILYLIRLSRKGVDIKPAGEVAETLGKAGKLKKWRSFGVLLVSLAAIIIGSEMLVTSSKTIINLLGLSDTVFGMTILAFLLSIEELARELPAARKGRPEISFGNVAGSVLAFFLFNAGIISLVQPVKVETEILWFHIPVSLITVILVSVLMMTKRINRWSGGILVILYFIFVVMNFYL